MASKVFPLEPRTVPKLDTRFRRIVTAIPVPQSLPILEQLRTYEPLCMQGQPPIVWDRAEGFTVSDRWGNTWIDFSSGVLITNAGHGHKKIIDAIVEQARHGLLTSYCFPNEARTKLVKKLVDVAPDAFDRCMLLSTGSEAIECAIKLARTYGKKISGDRKTVVVSFERAFHGRTLGAQLAGGIPALKTWIGTLPGFVQVPFPDGYLTKDVRFECFENTLAEKGIRPDDVAAVISETYQGGGADFGPPEYFQSVRKWCNEHNAVMIFDEVQAGFGRTGTFWGFEHYGVMPDLIVCGKGISSSLPISAVIGPGEIMNLYGPGSMTSTHTGNPICCAAALANIEIILDEKLVENSATVGGLMHNELAKVKDKYADRIGAAHGKGLVAALQTTQTDGQPDPDLAFDVVRRCVEKGVMFFAPVGFHGASVKIAPPLCITADAVKEGVAVIDEAFAETIG